MQFHVPRKLTAETQLDLIGPNLASRGLPPPPTDWNFAAQEEPLVPEPEINIVQDQAGGAILGEAIARKLAPRLDPKHVNALPELPRSLGATVAAASVELRILVLPDGTVGDAQIVRSAGQRAIDQIAIETVKDGWRYLPASLNNKPIEAWMTIIVHFATM